MIAQKYQNYSIYQFSCKKIPNFTEFIVILFYFISLNNIQYIFIISYFYHFLFQSYT